MPSPLPRRNRWVPTSFSFPNGGGLPRNVGGSASALRFSRPAQRSLHVTAYTLAESLTDPFTPECFSRFVTSTTVPIATGWNDPCRVGFAPTEAAHLCTAHFITAGYESLLSGASQFSLTTPPLENDELLAQTQVLSRQSRFGFGGSGKEAAKITDHLSITLRLLQSDQRFSIERRSMSLPDDIFAPYRCDPPESRHLTVAETLCVLLSQRSYTDRSNAASIRSTSRRDRRCSTMTTLDSRSGGTSASSRNVSMSASPATRRNRRSRAIRTSAWDSIAGYCIAIHTLTATDTPRGASRCHVASGRPVT